jgi:hypothetical protein
MTVLAFTNGHILLGDRTTANAALFTLEDGRIASVDASARCPR